MNNGEIIYWVVEIIAGIYMLGIGFRFLPDPGKNDSKKNEEHFNKFRGVFKIGGICTISYVALTFVSSVS
ncbi:MAG: hypothetical protein ABW168_01160 [Sedimenticola sp.]